MAQAKLQQPSGVNKGLDRRSTCRYTPTIKSVVLGWGYSGSRVELPAQLEEYLGRGMHGKVPGSTRTQAWPTDLVQGERHA